MMQDCPQQIVAGQPVPVSAAITNREHVCAGYVIENTADGDLPSRTDGIRLMKHRAWDGQLSFVPPEPAADQQVESLPLQYGGTGLYPTLHPVPNAREGP